MSKIFFTADHHFGHANVIKYCNRPFSSIEEMNTTLIERWNSVVGKFDHVFHVGDFTLGDIDEFWYFASQLNGNINIVPGSHDHRWAERFIKRHGLECKNIRILPQLHPCRNLKPTIVLCHYPMRSWESSFHGSWHLFGHVHGRYNTIDTGLSVDVGVDCHDFYPISYDQVKEFMLKRKRND